MRNQNFVTIVKEGQYEGLRLYTYDDVNNDINILHNELYCMFHYGLKKDKKIFYIKCSSNHNYIIPDTDIEYLKKDITTDMIDKTGDYNFSDITNKIKKLQSDDLIQLYNLFIDSETGVSFIIFPKILNNLYYFDLLLIVESHFDLNSFLNLKLNVIKVDSFIQYFSNTLLLENVENWFDFDNLQFKNNYLSSKVRSKTHPYNVYDLEEKKTLDAFYKKYYGGKSLNEMWNMDEADPNIELELELLKNSLSKKEGELWDLDLHKVQMFSNLSIQIISFKEFILEDCFFCVDYPGYPIKQMKIENGKLCLEENNLVLCNLTDLIFNDDYNFSIFFNYTYQWPRK